MTDQLPNASDGWVSTPPSLDQAQVLFLWSEMVRDGRIKAWFDEAGVFHVITEGHPGFELPPSQIGMGIQGVHV